MKFTDIEIIVHQDSMHLNICTTRVRLEKSLKLLIKMWEKEDGWIYQHSWNPGEYDKWPMFLKKLRCLGLHFLAVLSTLVSACLFVYAWRNSGIG